MPDALEQAAAAIRARLAEIEKERRRLDKALAILTSRSDERRSTRRRPARTRAGGTRPANGRPRGKRARRGERQAQFLAALKRRPDAGMSELAREIGVSPQQLYPIARRLSATGEIAKREGRYVVSAAPKAKQSA